MLTFGDFDAWLECAGEKMAVYDTKVDATSREVTCFVLAEEGKAFSVHWQDRGSGVVTAAYIELDGNTIPGKFLHGRGVTWRSGMRSGLESERPFVFAKVPEGGTNPRQNFSYDIQKLGKIALSIRKVTLQGQCTPNSITTSIPEPMKGKGRMFPLAVGYAAAQPTGHQHLSTHLFEPFDKTDPGPAVTFVFRYRDMEWMMVNGHNVPINMAPPPEPVSPSKRRKSKGKEKAAGEDGNALIPQIVGRLNRMPSTSSRSARRGRKNAEEQIASPYPGTPTEHPSFAAPTPFSNSGSITPIQTSFTVPFRHPTNQPMTSTPGGTASGSTPAPMPTNEPPMFSLFPPDPMTLSGQNEFLSGAQNGYDISRWMEGQPSQWGNSFGN